MPKSVEDVKLRIERVRLKFGVSAPPLEDKRLPLICLGSRWFGELERPDGVEGSESEGGVADVREMSKGRLGIGRTIGGDS